MTEVIMVSRDGTNCPFRDDDGWCRFSEGCTYNVSRPRTPEELDAYDARPKGGVRSDIEYALDMNDFYFSEAICESIGGKKKTPEGRAQALAEREERRRTHTYDTHFSKDCPLRKGDVTVRTEDE
jgi:hypothetical protein